MSPTSNRTERNGTKQNSTVCESDGDSLLFLCNGNGSVGRSNGIYQSIECSNNCVWRINYGASHCKLMTMDFDEHVLQSTIQYRNDDNDDEIHSKTAHKHTLAIDMAR